MNKRCLVLMPFSNPDGEGTQYWDAFFRAVSTRVETVLEQYKCDRFNIAAGHILGKLIQEILSSDLIICDLTYLKPNVLYELGMSMLLEKPTVLLVQGFTRIPSDFSNYAYLRYRFSQKSRRLSFPSDDRGQDMFEVSLKSMTERHTPHSFLRTDSNLGRVLKGIGNALKHAIQLETKDPTLASAMRSLLDNLISENAEKLSGFTEKEERSVSIQIDSPRILFEILVALIRSLGHEDHYDSITWRRHWGDRNLAASHEFLKVIREKAADLPEMRRIFLVGVISQKSDNTWEANPDDVSAVSAYHTTIRSQYRVENRVLFLPDRLVEPAADKCHMGRISKDDSELFVFSRYSDSGVLESFELSRNVEYPWKFEDFWGLSVEMHQIDWEAKPPSIPKHFVHFSCTAGKVSYEESLECLLDSVGLPQVTSLVAA